MQQWKHVEGGSGVVMFGWRSSQFKTASTACLFPSPFHTSSFVFSIFVFCLFEVCVTLRFVTVCLCVSESICLAGLCAVWNYAWGLGPHLLWISCNCSFGGLSVALSPSPSLSLCLSPLLFGLLLSFFGLTPTPLPSFSPYMAHYSWSPPAQSGNSLYTHTDRATQQFS